MSYQIGDRFVETPELDRMIAIKEGGQNDILSDFLNWLIESQGICFGTHTQELVWTHDERDPEQILLSYYDLSEETILAERMAVLAAIEALPPDSEESMQQVRELAGLKYPPVNIVILETEEEDGRD